MSKLVRICAESDLPAEGQARECITADGEFCIARVQGQIAVLDNACPHSQGPLGEGTVEEGHVVCPWHGWAFDVKTGVERINPAASVRVFESKVENGELRVVLD